MKTLNKYNIELDFNCRNLKVRDAISVFMSFNINHEQYIRYLKLLYYCNARCSDFWHTKRSNYGITVYQDNVGFLFPEDIAEKDYFNKEIINEHISA